MLTKLLAAVGLAGTLMLSLAAPAEAHGWDDGGFRRGPVYAGPGNRGVYWRHEVERRLIEWERARAWRRLQWLREHRPYGYRY